MTLSGPQSPAEGGPPWEEISTEHFTIETNWDHDEAVRLAREFEAGLRIMMKLAFRGHTKPTTKIRVFALTHDEFGQFSVLTRGRGGWDEFEPVVYWGGGADWEALHELGHALSMSFVRDQPRWFAEGIAMYLQMIRYNERTGEAELGRCPPELRFVTRQDFMTLEQMWDWSPSERDTPREARQYATSWAIVHYLLDQRPDQFLAFERALVEHTAPRRAWKRIFPDLDSTGFKRAIDLYLAAFKCEMQKATIPPGSIAIARRPLRDADVLGLRAWLYISLRGAADRTPEEDERLARENVARAVAEDPLSFGLAWSTTCTSKLCPLRARSPSV
jgi:hypothetical protein